MNKRPVHLQAAFLCVLNPIRLGAIEPKQAMVSMWCGLPKKAWSRQCNQISVGIQSGHKERLDLAKYRYILHSAPEHVPLKCRFCHVCGRTYLTHYWSLHE